MRQYPERKFVSIEEDVTVSVNFEEYCRSPDFGDILIAHWFGKTTRDKEFKNDAFMSGLMKAAIEVREPCGVILDLTNVDYCRASICQRAFFSMNCPVTDKLLPSAVVVSKFAMKKNKRFFEELEESVLCRKYFFVLLEDAIEYVVPFTKRLTAEEVK